MKLADLQGTKKGKSISVPSHIQYESISPATKLLEKRRQLYERHDRYEEQQKAFKIDEDRFREEEEEIKKKDLQIQEELIRYCKYLQDNDAKRARFIKKFKEEQRAKEAKDIEIAKLERTLEEVQNSSSKLEQKVSSLRKYEEYLELVIKKSDRYPNLDALYRQYSSLENAHNKLKVLTENMQQELETKRNQMTQLEKEKTNESLLLNNDIATLQKKHEDIEQKRQDMQQAVEASTNVASSKNLELSKIHMAIENIFSRCNDGSKILKESTEEKSEKKEDEKKDTRGLSPQKDKKEEVNKYIDDEDTKQKSEEATDRLKKITNFMHDFSRIIQEIKQEEKSKKPKSQHY